MLNNSGEIKALIELIDDPDEIVFKSITDRFVGLGKDVVPIIKEQLEFTAEEITISKINHIIHKINFNILENELLKWNESEQKSLLEAVLILSAFADAECNKRDLIFEIEKIKRSIWLELNDYLTSLEEVNVVNKVLFSYYKFSVSEHAEMEKSNFGLNSIMVAKKGSPRLIATLYILVADMLKIPIRAIEIPNQHLLGYCSLESESAKENENGILFFIEPTTGQVYTHSDVENYLRKIGHLYNTNSLIALTTKEYIKLWLTDIASFYKKISQHDKSDDIISLITNLD